MSRFFRALVILSTTLRISGKRVSKKGGDGGGPADVDAPCPWPASAPLPLLSARALAAGQRNA